MPGTSLDRDELAALLRAAQSGDKAGLDATVRALTPLLWHVARAQGLDRESSGDVVQTTWLLLLRGLDDIHAPEALVSWLVTVAKREAWRVSRAQRAEPPTGDEIPDEPDHEAGPEDVALTSARDRELWHAVGRLPERCRRLLRIVAFTHRPDYDRIAETLGVRRGSVGPLRGRCLARLRRMLSATSAGPGGDL
ncbi:RNA polymerase sigma factor [Lentzea sp. NPDC058450]|uniref:RNA polymerase sigma factor n=1 Tax=Lentzea sp. NPDC058450 TaxID=3346505 RepID=UPI00364DB0CE